MTNETIYSWSALAPPETRIIPPDCKTFRIADWQSPATISLTELAHSLSMSEPMVRSLVIEKILPNPVMSGGQSVFERAAVATALERAKVTDRATTVYIIGFSLYVKIGFTARPIRFRLMRIQTSVPERLTIYATMAGTKLDERRLHERFKALHIQGEWFRKEGELLAWIEAGCPMNPDQPGTL